MKDSLPAGTLAQFTAVRESPTSAPRRVPTISEFGFHGWENARARPAISSALMMNRLLHPVSLPPCVARPVSRCSGAFRIGCDLSGGPVHGDPLSCIDEFRGVR